MLFNAGSYLIMYLSSHQDQLILRKIQTEHIALFKYMVCTHIYL